MRNIKAVGFDLDGTLFRTNVNYSKLDNVDRTVLEKHGIPFHEIFEENSRKRLRYPIRKWLESNGRGNEYPIIEKEIDELAAYYEMEHLEDAEPFPRSLECLDYLKEKGLKIGLLTRGCHEYGKAVLSKFQVFEKMDAVVGRDYEDYDNAKPSPVAMYNLAKELEVNASEILYIGDNFSDYYSARDSDSLFIGVLSGSSDKNAWNSLSKDIQTMEYAGDIIDRIFPYVITHSYEKMEHTADTMIRCTGNTMNECFGNAAYALSNSMIDAESCDYSLSIKIEAEGTDYESMLFSFLSELLFIQETEQLALGRFNVFIDNKKVLCVAYGEKLNIKKHHPKGEVKAVTYHMMSVKENPLEITAVFDM